MLDRLFGYLRRREACRMAAVVCQGHEWDGDLSHHLWSVTVFFEAYLAGGAEYTQEDFGPKEAVDLKLVREGSMSHGG
jgi:hypothetical protein